MRSHSLPIPFPGLRRPLPIVLGALGLGLVGLFATLRLLASRPLTPLPVYGTVPAFELKDESGAPFGSALLQGRSFIADFVFTGCTESCPLLTARMAELERRLPDERLITFTVDPRRDTPERLRDYARKAGADPARWSFLTGPLEPQRNLVIHGFKLLMQAGDPSDQGAVLHDDHLVLIDGQRRIRGYYSTDGHDVDRLARDAVRLDR